MLEGRVALVTGGSRGIGREIAMTLARYGAKVMINYHGSEEKAEETAELIRENGGEAQILQGSVADPQTCASLVEQTIRTYGKLDILVNNAGITRDNLVMKISEEDFDAVLDTNLKGAFHMIKAAYRPFLKQRSGRIINISSVSGILGNAGQANYAASKAGVIGLTKSVARELASRNVTVNAVAPGFIDTDMTRAMNGTAREAAVSQIPMKRAGEAVEIAETVAFLASDKAAYITGQVISVDGGMTM